MSGYDNTKTGNNPRIKTAGSPNDAGTASSQYAITAGMYDADLSPVPRAIMVRTAGNVEVLAKDDTVSVVWVGLVPGEIIQIQAKRVLSAGTSGGMNLIALL